MFLCALPYHSSKAEAEQDDFMKAFRVANFEMQEAPAAPSTSDAVAAAAAAAVVDLEAAAAVAALGAQAATLVEEVSAKINQECMCVEDHCEVCKSLNSHSWSSWERLVCI